MYLLNLAGFLTGLDMKKFLLCLLVIASFTACGLDDGDDNGAGNQTSKSTKNINTQLNGTYVITDQLIVYPDNSVKPHFSNSCKIKSIYTIQNGGEVCIKTQWECSDNEDLVQGCINTDSFLKSGDISVNNNELTILYYPEPGFQTRTLIKGKRISTNVIALDDEPFWKTGAADAQ